MGLFGLHRTRLLGKAGGRQGMRCCSPPELPSGRGSSELGVAWHSLFLPCNINWAQALCPSPGYALGPHRWARLCSMPEGGGKMAYLFAEGTNNRNLCSQVLKARSQKSKFWTVHTPCRGLRADSLPASCGWWHFWVCSYITPVSVSISCGLLLCAWVKSLCLSLIRTLIIGFRAHPNDLGLSHPEILNLITSAKTLFSK